MKSNYKRLGDYIRQVDVRNRDLAVDNLLGLSISKQFIPSIANTIGTDMANYKIVQSRQFAYVPVTSRNGDKITVALYEGDRPCIISQAYVVFEITATEKLLPEYLMMWFRRPEFDRFARFKSHGSAREVFEWEEMCEVMLPVPSIEVQRQIVAEYQAVEQRIENNRRFIATLEKAAQTIYRKMFVDDIDPNNLPQGWRMGTIGDFGEVITGKTPSSSCPEDFGEDIDFITPGEFKDENIFLNPAVRQLSQFGAKKLKNKLIPEYSIAVTCIGYVGKTCVVDKPCISNQQINTIVPLDKSDFPYIFFCIKDKGPEIHSIAVGGSTLPMLSKTEFENVKVVIPHKTHINSFWTKTEDIFKLSLSSHKEINILDYTLSLLLTKLSTL